MAVGCETPYHTVSALEKQRGRNSGAQLTFSPFPCCDAVSSWDAAVLIQSGSFLFSYAFLEISYRQTQGNVSWLERISSPEDAREDAREERTCKQKL